MTSTCLFAHESFFVFFFNLQKSNLLLLAKSKLTRFMEHKKKETVYTEATGDFLLLNPGCEFPEKAD